MDQQLTRFSESDEIISEHNKIERIDSLKAELRPYLDDYLHLKNAQDHLQKLIFKTREKIENAMQSHGIEYTEFPYDSNTRVSYTLRRTETVTREGRSFIKVHCTPELLDALIKTTERRVLVIRSNLIFNPETKFEQEHHIGNEPSDDPDEP